MMTECIGVAKQIYLRVEWEAIAVAMATFVAGLPLDAEEISKLVSAKKEPTAR